MLAACGGGNGTTGVPTGAARTVAITATDALKFDPASVAASNGETVRFVVTNAGATTHEFVVGDQTFQDQHAAMMKQGTQMSMAGELANLSIPAGETKEATITFGAARTLLYACHVAGHYEAGMKGTITIT